MESVVDGGKLGIPNEEMESRVDAAASTYQPDGFSRRYSTIRDLDPHMASVWSTYLGSLLARPQLDKRTRLLVLIGQYAISGTTDRLREAIRACITEDLDPREVLEVIFHSMIYAGEARMTTAVDVFCEVITKAGMLETVRAGAVNWARVEERRSEDEERGTWAAEDVEDPRTVDLLDRYGWNLISPGYRLRPRSHINQIATLDLLDTDFARLWLETVWAGMYMRGVLDDRTRILCMVGNCLALGESIQLRAHIRGAIEQGATPTEVLEVIFQSCVTVGHPLSLVPGIDTLVEIVDGMGRLRDLTDLPEDLKATVSSRKSGRGAQKETQE
jgi:alkylhydroperoxidase/carboxymuconolactone decarboxylase family protein YurZ